MAHPIFSEDHDLIRAQLRRFVEEKVKPDGPKWEEAGFVPRELLLGGRRRRSQLQQAYPSLQSNERKPMAAFACQRMQ